MNMKLLDIPEQTSTDGVDEEILEIFVEEVKEVLEEIINSFSAWQEDPADQDALKNLRRAFHTLKGSGRLVGATVIGELGWRFESMLNRVIDGTIARSEVMFKFIAQVENILPSLIKQFQNAEPAPQHVIVLISQVNHFTETKGQSQGEFEDIENTQPTVVPPARQPPPRPEVKTEKAIITVEPDELEAETVIDETECSVETELDFAEETFDSETIENIDSEMEICEETMFLDAEPMDEAENLDIEISELDFNETETLTLEEEFTLTDFAETDFEHADPENLSETVLTEDSEEDVMDPVLLDIFKREANQHIEELKYVLEVCEQELPLPVVEGITRNFHTLNGSSRSVNCLPISTLAGPMETLAREMSERHTDLTADTLALFQHATEWVERFVNEGILDETQQRDLLTNANRVLESLPPLPPKTLSKAAEPVTAADDQRTAVVEPPDATDEFMSIFLDEAEEILENTQSLLERWRVAPHNMQLMRELQRELHTLKGGARMVGITPMGDLSHHLESVLTQIVEFSAQSSPKLQEIVQNSVDELAAMLEAVRAGVPLEMPSDLIAQINTTLKPEGGQEETLVKMNSAGGKEKEVAPSKPTQMAVEEEELAKDRGADKDGDGFEAGEDRIRVRVALIDRLTGLAGELSIFRAHMEQQQGAFKNNLTEMEQTVTRLRDQLRRLEIETEAQILSHYQGVKETDMEEFDPLELDRFSLLQQLSRSLMESISDLLNIQDALKTVTRQSDTLLIQQTRIGAELQDNIMRTRMVPFARISPRLQRISRLTARELHKGVEFVINGESIEFERTVLNRILAPLEHMLRNAIGHGIEDTETRQQAGKPTMAQVTIDLAREGADLIIKMSDDGRGLDLPAIRRKAEERNLIEPGAVVSDQELMQFILLPTFSTAKVVSQIAGRGVGMDIVNNEIKQLSGSLQISSKAGEGTTFEIRLPLSLTINQALLVHIGEETMAIPLNNVDAVLRIARPDVLGHQPDEARYYHYMDHDYRIFHLGDVLGFGRVASVDTPLIPTLLVRSGSRRMALLVDGIEGSKEIVVKSVGPQIGTIQWLSGATILGDGRVVLILDVPSLARVDTTPQYTQQFQTPVPEKKLAVATIMVVDDSITVRKVTARLLKRQGMEVMMAKDGVDAVAQLQEQIPDLMLLDVEMPRMDGYELATQVRNDPRLQHIPIIMITSRTGVKHRDRAEKIGINRYLGKPFNEAELLENINVLLAERPRPNRQKLDKRLS